MSISSMFRSDAIQVIIDNMMNLQLLFAAMSLNNNSTFRDIAISHADRTIKNHIRKDGKRLRSQTDLKPTLI
jgi:hypothetical protein